MKKDNALNRLVYEYYETRILYGYYEEGDCLPSIPKICAVFQLAPATVRQALGELEDQGYVKVDARKSARVIYRAGNRQFRENAARYFVPRERGIRDLSVSGQLLFEPLWEEGVRRWGGRDWERLLERMQKPSEGAVAMPVQFYILALRVLDNRLILNLYWETIRYIRFPYLAAKKSPEVLPQALGERGDKDEIICFLRETFEKSYRESSDKFFRFIRQAALEFDIKDEEEIPFQWNIYRQRPQLRYTLASRIIREIIAGTYQTGSYLPSLPKLAQRYGAALTTVRRTVSVLENLGIVRAYQGKGIQICRGEAEINYEKPDIQEGMRLYLESLQFLALTIKQAAAYSLVHTSPENRKYLAQEFLRLKEIQKSYMGFEIILSFICKKCPLDLVRETYGRIRELLNWGYPVTKIRLKSEDLHEKYMEKVTLAGNHLKEEKLDAFSEDWKQLLEQEERQVRIFLEGKMRWITERRDR